MTIITDTRQREFEAMVRTLDRAIGNREAVLQVAPVYQAAFELGIIPEPDPGQDYRHAIARYALSRDPHAFLFFARHIAGYNWIPDEPHLELAGILMHPYWRKVVYVPRGGLKTTMGGIIQSARDILDDPAGESIEYGMINKLKSGAVGGELMGLFEKPALIHFFGDHHGRPWSPDAFNLDERGRSKDHSFMAASIDAPLVGKHPRRARLDDLYDIQHRHPAHLEAAWGFFQGIFQEADRADSGFEVYMTRWHTFDVFHSILELNDQAPPERKFLFFVRADGRYSNEPDQDIGFIKNGVYYERRPDPDPVTAEDEPVTWRSWWPEKFSEGFAQEQRRALGNIYYNLQYKNRALDEGTARFKLEWFPTWTELPPVARVVLAMDPAYAVNQDSDFTAIMLALLTPEGKYYLVDGDLEKYSGTVERARAIGRILLRWPQFFLHGAAGIEGYGDIDSEMNAVKAEIVRLWETRIRSALAAQRPLQNFQRRPLTLGVRYTKINQSNNPGNKEDRIGSIDCLAESGGILLPPAGHRIITQADGNIHDLRDLLVRLFQYFPELPPGAGLWDLGDACQMLTRIARPPAIEITQAAVDRYQIPDFTDPPSGNPFVRRNRVYTGGSR